MKNIPFSIFAQEVVSAFTKSPELQAWKLCDLTIRPLYVDPPWSNIALMRAIASVIPTIYSFYGLGYINVMQTRKNHLNQNNGSLDSYVFGSIGEDL